jgi:hypothetical protein
MEINVRIGMINFFVVPFNFPDQWGNLHEIRPGSGHKDQL